METIRKPKTEETEEFQTSDINLAAFLLCRKFDFFKPPEQENRLTTFVFKQSPELTLAVSDYYSRRASVDALTLFEQQKVTKGYVWDNRKAAARGGESR